MLADILDDSHMEYSQLALDRNDHCIVPLIHCDLVVLQPPQLLFILVSLHTLSLDACVLLLHLPEVPVVQPLFQLLLLLVQ